jgi:hypothetical protein
MVEDAAAASSASSLSGLSEYTIVDDLPAPVSITCVEVDAIDTYLGRVLDRLLRDGSVDQVTPVLNDQDLLGEG